MVGNVKSMEYHYQPESPNLAVISDDQQIVAAYTVNYSTRHNKFDLNLYPGEAVENIYELEFKDTAGLMKKLNEAGMTLRKSGYHLPADSITHENTNPGAFIRENISDKHGYKSKDVLHKSHDEYGPRGFTAEQFLEIIGKMEEVGLMTKDVADTIRDFVSRQHPGEDVSVADAEEKSPPTKGTGKE